MAVRSSQWSKKYNIWVVVDKNVMETPKLNTTTPKMYLSSKNEQKYNIISPQHKPEPPHLPQPSSFVASVDQTVPCNTSSLVRNTYEVPTVPSFFRNSTSSFLEPTCVLSSVLLMSSTVLNKKTDVTSQKLNRLNCNWTQCLIGTHDVLFTCLSPQYLFDSCQSVQREEGSFDFDTRAAQMGGKLQKTTSFMKALRSTRSCHYLRKKGQNERYRNLQQDKVREPLHTRE